MNSFRTNPLVLATLATAAVIVLPSCVDPYYNSPPATSTTVTTYRTGYEVRELPRGYRTEVIEGNRYYVHDNTYYRPRAGGYVVVETPRRLRRDREIYVERLPRGYRTVRYGGRQYYRVNDTYYVERGPGYTVVERPF